MKFKITSLLLFSFLLGATAQENVNMDQLIEITLTEGSTIDVDFYGEIGAQVQIVNGSSIDTRTLEFASIDEPIVAQGTSIKIYGEIESFILSDDNGNNSNITALSVSNTKLIILECKNSSITTLDLSNNPVLETVTVNGSNLSSLKFGPNNSELNTIYCENNNLTACDLDATYKTLPDRTDTSKGKIYINGNPGLDKSSHPIASEKFWDVIGPVSWETVTNTEFEECEDEIEVEITIGFISFSIPNQIGESEFNHQEKTIRITMPNDIDITALSPEISVLENNIISPANGETQDFTNPVTYTLTGNNNETEVWTITVVQDVTTSIFNFVSQPNFKYYPNPVINELYLENDNAIINIKIYSTTGLILLNIDIKNNFYHNLDLSQLPSGLYFVHAQTTAGIKQFKIVKK